MRVSRNRLRTPAAVGWEPVGERALVVDAAVDALVSVDLATGDRSILSDRNTGVGQARR